MLELLPCFGQHLPKLSYGKQLQLTASQENNIYRRQTTLSMPKGLSGQTLYFIPAHGEATVLLPYDQAQPWHALLIVAGKNQEVPGRHPVIAGVENPLKVRLRQQSFIFAERLQ